MNSQINELLNKQDNAEKIRDQITALLKLELINQKKLAEESPEVINKKDYNINVYLENSRPWELVSDNPDKNPFPLVNVSLAETGEGQTSKSTTGQIKYTTTYYLDCYGCGNNQPEEAGEYIPDDSLSTIRAWQTARVTRNIIMSGQYYFLGSRNIVRKRRITKIQTIIPANQAESAISVTACRIILEVELHENAPEAAGVDFEGITFKSNDNGEVNLIDLMTDNTKENQKE